MRITLGGVGHPCQLLFGAPLEVIPVLLHLLARPLPVGDGVDLGSDALPEALALGHTHLPALGTVQLGVVTVHLLNQDLVLLVGEAGLAEAGDLLSIPGHAWHWPQCCPASGDKPGLCPQVTPLPCPMWGAK
uniref:Uncharacterized protein n=1 Tax=Pelusios castaneus TaxID=367368 RepID=A0A8C8RBS2_9SAUR